MKLVYRCAVCGWTIPKTQDIAPRCCNNWQMVPDMEVGE